MAHVLPFGLKKNPCLALCTQNVKNTMFFELFYICLNVQDLGPGWMGESSGIYTD